MVSDLMHIDKQTTLISVCTPLELTLCAHVEDTKESLLGKALQAKISMLWSRSFACKVVIMDLQKGLAALVGKFPGTHIYISGAGDHLSKVDCKIRRKK